MPCDFEHKYQLNRYKICRSRDIYLLLRDKVTSKVLSATKYLRQYRDIDDVNYTYTERVWLEKEIKLKEFNFKVLHGILPCDKNLKQWKIRMSDCCDVCGRFRLLNIYSGIADMLDLIGK